MRHQTLIKLKIISTRTKNKQSNILNVSQATFRSLFTDYIQKQARRVYEILRFQATNLADIEEYRAYRLDIKRRLNIPYQVC